MVGLLGVCGSVLAYVFPPARRFPKAGAVEIGDESEIPLDKGKLALFEGQPVWVLHLKRGVVALSAICTHKGCLVEWDEHRRVLSCPCHEGLFDTHGNVLRGLPPRPLPRFRVAILQGKVYLVGRSSE